MSGRTNLDRRTKQNITADDNRRRIQYDAVKIEKDLASKNNIGAVVTVKGGLNPNSLTGPAEQFPDD